MRTHTLNTHTHTNTQIPNNYNLKKYFIKCYQETTLGNLAQLIQSLHLDQFPDGKNDLMRLAIPQVFLGRNHCGSDSRTHLQG